MIDNLLLGFSTALTFSNLMWCLLGTVLGTLIGVLPGLGPAATIAMLLPITFTLSPTASLIMLAGIYYGSQYGGSTTAILVNLPGETSSVMTAVDGHKMARQGHAGKALSAAAIGSFVGGTFGILLVALFAVPLSSLALKFGPPEYFSLMVLGLLLSVVLARGSIVYAIGMVILGLLFGLVGTDIRTGTQRFTFGIVDLFDGVNFVVITMGIFGISEILINLEKKENRDAISSKLQGLFPSREDLKRMVPPILRGTFIGSILGTLPGGGATLASFAAYSAEKKLSRNKSELGEGAIEGVAAPETANNAAAQTSFIPMLTLGVPSNAVMALMVGAMILQGIQPGPAVMTSQPALFWGLIASMWVGNLFLVVLNLPLVGIWAKMTAIPYKFLFPIIIVCCSIGALSLSNSTFDLYVMAIFGVFGYICHKLGAEPAPLLLGYIVGPMMEEYLRRALLIYQDPLVFFQRPISASLLTIALLAVILSMATKLNQMRKQIF